MGSEEVKSAAAFLNVALSMHLITDNQYLSTADYWSRAGGDIGDIVVSLGLLTDAQSATIKHLMSQDVAFPPVHFPMRSFSPFEEYESVLASKKDSLFETVDLSSSTGDSDDKELDSHRSSPKPTSVQLRESDILFSNYSFIGRIGQGGLGQVSQCCDRSFDRDVALKEIRADLRGPDHKRLMMRFWLEARVTGQLQHPGIVPVHEMGLKPDGSLYYTMKHVQGMGLDKALAEIQDSNESPDQKYKKRMRYLNNLLAMCRAIGYAHDKGVIHRDLKPGNVILGRHGETIILDWGLAKLINTPDIQSSEKGTLTNDTRVISFFNNVEDNNAVRSSEELTLDGELVGTPSYMAPEQIDSTFGPVGKHSDVYSLGVILYRIITGESPYQNKSSARMLLREISDRNTANPTPSVPRVNIPPDLVAICDKALNKSADQRFENARIMGDELAAFLEGRQVSFYTYSAKESIKRFVRRNKLAASFMFLFIISLIGGAVVSGIFAYMAREGRDSAKKEAFLAQEAQMNAEFNRQKASDAEAIALKTVEQLPKFADVVLNQTLLMGKSIENKLTDMRQDLENAVTQSDFDDPGANRSAILKRLNTVMKSNKHWISLIVTDTSGTICEIVPDHMSRSIGVNISTQLHIQQALKTRSTYCSSLFENPEKNFTGVSIVVPILRNGDIIGLIGGVFNPNEIIGSVINEDSMGEMLMGLAIDKKGYVLLDEAYPDRTFQNLFSDPFYESNPDFLSVCMKIFSQPFGVGHYKWILPQTNARTVHRIIAWHEINMEQLGMGDLEKWGIVLMGSYLSGERDLMTRNRWKSIQESQRVTGD